MACSWAPAALPAVGEQYAQLQMSKALDAAIEQVDFLTSVAAGRSGLVICRKLKKCGVWYESNLWHILWKPYYMGSCNWAYCTCRYHRFAKVAPGGTVIMADLLAANSGGQLEAEYCSILMLIGLLDT